MVKKSVPDGLADALRCAIEASGLSQNQIALKAGMEPSRISRFMRRREGFDRRGRGPHRRSVRLAAVF